MNRTLGPRGSVSTNHDDLTNLNWLDAGHTIDDHIVPEISGTYDLGSASLPFRSAYLTGGTLYLDGIPLETTNSKLYWNNIELKNGVSSSDMIEQINTTLNTLQFLTPAMAEASGFQTLAQTVQYLVDNQYMTRSDVEAENYLTSTDLVNHALVGHSHLIADVSGLQTDLDAKLNSGLLASPSGIATLDANGKVLDSQLPASLIGALSYQGILDASNGLYPAASQGDYYVISISGTIVGTAYAEGDWAVYNGSSWDKIDNANGVSTVNNQTGAVTILHNNLADIAVGDVHTQYLLTNGSRQVSGLMRYNSTFDISAAHNDTLTSKIYVDTKVSDDIAQHNLDIPHTNFILKDGTRAFTGVVSGITPTLGSHLATKAYVDGQSTNNHSALANLTADDHTIYSLIDGSRAFTGKVTGIATENTDLTTTLTTKGYVDSKAISDHGALTGLTDDDHTQYLKADGTRNISGVIVGVTPTLASHLATKGYVDTALTAGIDHGTLSGRSDDDHTQYIKADGTRGFSGTLTGSLVVGDNLKITKNATFPLGIYTTSGATQALDWSTYQRIKLNCGHTVALTFIPPNYGATHLTNLLLIINWTGTFTITWPTIKWAGAVSPTLSGANGKIDMITLIYDGTNYYGNAVTNFA